MKGESRIGLAGLGLGLAAIGSLAFAGTSAGHGPAAIRASSLGVHSEENGPRRAEEFGILTEEYAAAVAAHEERLRGAENGRERTAIRREHPALAFAPRFELLAEAGHVGALGWMAANLDDAMKRGKAREQRRLELYERLVAADAADPYFVEAVTGLPGDSRLRREQGMATVARLTGLAIAGLEVPADRDGLRLGLARAWSASREEGASDRAAELLAAVVDGGHLPAAQLAEAERLRFALLHLRPGRLAPDFEGTTIDGDPVSLAEHRGKVVVLNFFGFW